MKVKKKTVWSYKPLSTCHQWRISSKSWNSTVCFDNSVSALTGREWQPIPISNVTRKNKACQNELERCLLRATCGEKQSQGGGQGVFRGETVTPPHDSVPDTHIMQLPPQWVTQTGYCLCSTPPQCDWWVSFCQLMENPLLTTIRLQFVTVSVSDCQIFFLISDLLLLWLFYSFYD